MNLDPLLASSLSTQVHTAAALLALGFGLLQFLTPRGSVLHRTMGWCWVSLMAVTAISSFAIHNIQLVGIWSPIHLLSLVTLGVLVLAVCWARQGNVKAHRSAMISLFFFALIGAGAFTLLPGRLMHAVLFGG